MELKIFQLFFNFAGIGGGSAPTAFVTRQQRQRPCCAFESMGCTSIVRSSATSCTLRILPLQVSAAFSDAVIQLTASLLHWAMEL
jgi:hypothetical protein